MEQNLNKAKWIWYPGDYEIYHSLLLHARREEYGYIRPGFWRQDDCYHSCIFRKEFTLSAPAKINVAINGEGHIICDGNRLPCGEYLLEAGIHRLDVLVVKLDGLPCAYVTGGEAASDESWLAGYTSSEYVSGVPWPNAGCSHMYQSLTDNPEQFPFAYEAIAPVSAKAVPGGTLYDFGKETFTKLAIRNKGEEAILSYGESQEEALDLEYSIVRDRVKEGEEKVCPPRAFRYLYITGPEENCTFQAEYEYLPLKRKGSFRCSDDTLDQIWEMCAYTFHLNTREFFLDGIKRDRWVWSGDAYQSYLVNNYLFHDDPSSKRTILALRGKEPVAQHINTIADYSLYWLMSVGEYYEETGDLAFVRSLWPRMESLMEFCIARTDEDGFLIGLPGDWIFIDWADLDKDGPICAEQMLLVKSLEAMAACASLLGVSEEAYTKRALALRKKIERYWDEEQGAYIDSFTSGKRFITRHTNLFALRFGFAQGERRERICQNVLKNDAVAPITTPYFKFYEMEALCEMGELDRVRKDFLSYWGGMLRLGATTVWETFDPREQGTEHYAMYGDRFGKSLCHAWGASPIYLIGRYFLGVRSLSTGGKTFEVAPSLAGLDWMEGTVPLENGSVSVSLNRETLCVSTDLTGGVLLWKEKRIPIPAGEPLFLNV